VHSKERDQLRQRIKTETNRFFNAELKVYLRNEVDGSRKLKEDEVLHQLGIS